MNRAARLAAGAALTAGAVVPARALCDRIGARGLPGILYLTPSALAEAHISGIPVPGPKVAGTEVGQFCVLGPYSKALLDHPAMLAALDAAGCPRIEANEVVVAHWADPTPRLSRFGRGGLAYGHSSGLEPRPASRWSKHAPLKAELCAS